MWVIYNIGFVRVQNNWKCVLLLVIAYYDVGYYNKGFVRVKNNCKCVLLIVYYDVSYYNIGFADLYQCMSLMYVDWG